MRSKLESAKGDTFSGTVITDVLYGAEDGSDLHSSMDEINQYNVLRRWTSSEWANLLQRYVLVGTLVTHVDRCVRYYVDPPSVVVCGKPSAALADKLEKDEKTRVAEQVEKLGPDGLKKAEAELEAAKAEHGKPIPSDILIDFPVPDVKSISWITVQSVQEPGKGRKVHPSSFSSEPLSAHIDADGNPLAFFVEYDHVEVRFLFYSFAQPDNVYPIVTSQTLSRSMHSFRWRSFLTD